MGKGILVSTLGLHHVPFLLKSGIDGERRGWEKGGSTEVDARSVGLSGALTVTVAESIESFMWSIVSNSKRGSSFHIKGGSSPRKYRCDPIWISSET